jgi:pimeloyl-ACP methyl ester carboxylesterase
MAAAITRDTCRRAAALAGATVISLGVVACTASSPEAGSPSRDATAGASAIDELVDLGSGRSVKLVCRGSGSPTVLFVSGTRGAADEWSTLLPDAAPGTLSTFDAVSQNTRACAYDRPGTFLDSGAPTTSTPVAQPTTATRSADDLHALMAAADQNGPYVVVGLSWGGMIAQQFARTYDDEVVGLVLLDSASEYLQTTFTPEQWAAWMAVVANSVDEAGSEVPSYEPSIAELRATPTLPAMPTVVVSSDQPWDLQVTPGASTWPGWVAAQAELARSLDAMHITQTDSGHGLPVEQPALVTEAILEVVSATRDDLS